MNKIRSTFGQLPIDLLLICSRLGWVRLGFFNDKNLLAHPVVCLLASKPHNIFDIYLLSRKEHFLLAFTDLSAAISVAMCLSSIPHLSSVPLQQQVFYLGMLGCEG